jgi:hypothetical protein
LVIGNWEKAPTGRNSDASENDIKDAPAPLLRLDWVGLVGTGLTHDDPITFVSASISSSLIDKNV